MPCISPDDLFPRTTADLFCPGKEPFAAFTASGEDRGTGMTRSAAAAEYMHRTREPADSWPS
jgi:hypothetical protein